MDELTEEQMAKLASIPPIPREVYQRALGRGDNSRYGEARARGLTGIEHQIACAVETGWTAAWHQALGITDDETEPRRPKLNPPAPPWQERATG